MCIRGHSTSLANYPARCPLTLIKLRNFLKSLTLVAARHLPCSGSKMNIEAPDWASPLLNEVPPLGSALRSVFDLPRGAPSDCEQLLCRLDSKRRAPPETTVTRR